MEFLKKYWYLPVIFALILFIFTMPKKTYKVIPKDNIRKDSIINALSDSINNLIIENYKLILQKNEIQVETVTVEISPKPKKVITHKSNEILKKSDSPTFYVDPKRDNLWSKRNSTSK